MPLAFGAVNFSTAEALGFNVGVWVRMAVCLMMRSGSGGRAGRGAAQPPPPSYLTSHRDGFRVALFLSPSRIDIKDRMNPNQEDACGAWRRARAECWQRSLRGKSGEAVGEKDGAGGQPHPGATLRHPSQLSNCYRNALPPSSRRTVRLRPVGAAVTWAFPPPRTPSFRIKTRIPWRF